jgi:dockerin type I repeat protein/Big-like domain-containing protein
MIGRLFTRIVRGVLLAGASVLASIGSSTAATAQAAAPLTITSPVSGATVTAGQSIPVTIAVASGIYPHGVGLYARDPLGGADLKPVVGSAVTLTMSIPAYTAPGPYSVFAVAVNAAGALVNSAPITVDVERSDPPAAITAFPTGSMSLRFVGDTNTIVVLGAFAGAPYVELTNSSRLVMSSENPNIATVQNGLVTAVASGHTDIDVTYGSITAKVPVTVPSAIRGDLNGDGIVDQSDLNIILAGLNTPANGPSDARDLNHDGKVNELDAQILVTLCTRPKCASR